MLNLGTKLLVGAAAAVFLSACQVQKSANPLSPGVAGPVEGVVISTPNLLEPGQGWEMKGRDQPLKLLFANAATNGARPLKYSFDIATDSEFKTIVFARTGIEPNAAGETLFQLPDKLAAGTYWLRSRATDGANTGPYAPVKSFIVVADVVLSPPTALSPISGATVSDLTPEFKVKAGDRSGVKTTLEYMLQVSNNSSFTSIAATFLQSETWPETRVDQGYSFLHSRTYYWRVRAIHTADGTDMSNWSATQTFKTPAPPAAPAPAPGPAPSPGGGGGPVPGGGDLGKCSSSSGSDIAECIEAKYPQYRKAGVSLATRKSNMQFLRDRLIEHAQCRGLQVGQNLKRGGPEISNDFITYFTGGRWVGVDIASGYDDTSQVLNMTWYQHGASTNYGYPYHKAYGPASCP